MQVEKASLQTAILKSANMSLGINLLLELLGQAAATLTSAGFDIEIVEKHHNQKVDAPSGTALALADAMNDVLLDAYSYKYDRSTSEKSGKNMRLEFLRCVGEALSGSMRLFLQAWMRCLHLHTRHIPEVCLARVRWKPPNFLPGSRCAFTICRM